MLLCFLAWCAEVFRFLRTGYGALGVLVTLDLAVWPLWTMEQIVAPYDLGDLMKALPALLTQYDRLQWYFTPYTTNATLLIRANTTAPITGCWNPIGPAPNAPVTPPPRGMAVWPAGTRSCVDLSYKTLTHNGDDVQRYTGEGACRCPTMKQTAALPVDGCCLLGRACLCAPTPRPAHPAHFTHPLLQRWR